MNRTTVAVIVTLSVLVIVAGTGMAGFTAAATLQQSQALNINVWLSPAESTDQVRRLDSGTQSAQIVIQSDLRDSDPNRFRAEVWDANGIRVFQSDTLQLPTGAHSESIQITGGGFFRAYATYAGSEKTAIQNAVAEAISEANRSDPAIGPVRGPVQDALAIEDRLSNALGRLRAFDLSADGGADASFSAALSALVTVGERGTEVLELLNSDEVNWDDVRAKLQAMQTAAGTAATQIDAGLAAANLDADRSFPPTGVTGRCNQNVVQLRVASSDAVSDDYWWTVGAYGAPARLANPDEPTAAGTLRARRVQIYSMQVDVADAPHSTVVEALALDELCLPVPGVAVNFSTLAPSVATVQTPQVTTDANGVAAVTVNATNEIGNGIATVSASVNSATASIGLTVIGPASSLDLRLGGSEVQRTPNYGVESTVQVSAVAKDANGNDVANGTAVRFSINPPDHSFTDSGQVTTAGGQASAILVFGSATGLYTITAEIDSVSDAQSIRVVGNPAEIDVQADPRIVSVDTPIVDRRSSQLTVTVRDDTGQWAPDSTIVEFDFADPDDADWAYFTLRPDGLGRYTTPITDGQVSTSLVGSSTNLQNPNQRLVYREVTVRVTATYTVSGETRASVSGEVTVLLRGQTVFLPLIALQ